MPNKPHTGINIHCLHCNKEFYIPKNRINTAKYCSMQCLGKGTTYKLKTNCKICGKEFEHICSRANKAKYCSRKCYYKGQSLNGTIIKKCMHCDKEFKSSPSQKRKYCSMKCISKENHKTFKPTFTTVRKALLIRGKITKCERCGFNEYPKILGVHHKDRNRNNNAITNLEVLCPNCHSIEHQKHISQGGNE